MRYLIGPFILVGLLLPAQHALACSPPQPSVRLYAEWAEVIAIGTLEERTSDVTALQVEEYLKSGVRTPALTINNRRFDVTPNCQISARVSGRLPVGVRVLAFLQRDELGSGANWRPIGLMGEAIFTIDGDGQLVPVDWDVPITGSVEAAKAELAALVGPPQAPDPLIPGEVVTSDGLGPGSRRARHVSQVVLILVLTIIVGAGTWVGLHLGRRGRAV